MPLGKKSPHCTLMGVDSIAETAQGEYLWLARNRCQPAAQCGGHVCHLVEALPGHDGRSPCHHATCASSRKAQRLLPTTMPISPSFHPAHPSTAVLYPPEGRALHCHATSLIFLQYSQHLPCLTTPDLSGVSRAIRANRVIRANRKFEWFVRIGLTHYKNRGFNCE